MSSSDEKRKEQGLYGLLKQKQKTVSDNNSNIGQHENFCHDYYNNYIHETPEKILSNSKNNQSSPPKSLEWNNHENVSKHS